MLLTVVKQFGAISALKEECLAKGNILQACLQLHDLGWGDNGRKTSQFGKGLLDALVILIDSLLMNWLRCPRDWRPRLRRFAGVSKLARELRAAGGGLGSARHGDGVQEQAMAMVNDQRRYTQLDRKGAEVSNVREESDLRVPGMVEFLCGCTGSNVLPRHPLYG